MLCITILCIWVAIDRLKSEKKRNYHEKKKLENFHECVEIITDTTTAREIKKAIELISESKSL